MSVRDQVVATAEPELRALADKARANFMTYFGDFVESAHKDRLEKLFKEAAEAKLKSVTVAEPKERADYEEVARMKLASIATLGLAVKITGSAKAASILKETATQVLDMFVSVAGTLLKSLISGVVQGAVVGLTGGAAPAIGGTIAGVAGTFLAGGGSAPGVTGPGK